MSESTQGPNALSLPFVEALYAQYLRDPGAVPPEWRSYFERISEANGFAADPRLEPSFPKVKLYILASILFGALLGACTAHTLETLDRRVRCVDDVARLMRMRLLSVVERDASPGTLALQRRNAPLALPRHAG